jgi:pilus assembly protein CpaF
LQQGLLNSYCRQGNSVGDASMASTAGGAANKSFDDLKCLIHRKLAEKLDFTRVKDLQSDTLRKDIRRLIEHLCDAEKPLLNRTERERLIDEILDETLGFGPLEALLKDPTISDIFINGPDNIFVERHGKLQRTTIKFRNNYQMVSIIERIEATVGQPLKEESVSLLQTEEVEA